MIVRGDGGNKTTKLERIGERAKLEKDAVFNNLGHAVDLDLLRECYRQLDGKKAVGIDGETKATYGEKLEENSRIFWPEFVETHTNPKPRGW